MLELFGAGGTGITAAAMMSEVVRVPGKAESILVGGALGMMVYGFVRLGQSVVRWAQRQMLQYVQF